MKKLLSSAVATTICLVLAASSFAQVTDNSGAGFAFADNDPAGASSSITIATSETIVDAEVTLFGLNHTWVGDLTATLDDGNGNFIDILARTGTVGGVGFGSATDLDGGDYTFSDSGADFTDAAIAGVLPAGTYAPETFDGVNSSFAAVFGGGDTAGTWTLTISDNAIGDLGGFTGWGVSFTTAAIPEPSSLALFGLTGIACVLRRRR